MACQNCTATCNCQISEDGPYAFRGDEDGRHNTTVSGRGIPSSPFVLEFQQSENYRPPSGELNISVSRVFISNASNQIMDPTQDVFATVYESPNMFFLNIPSSGTTLMTFVKGLFHAVGGSVTFVSHSFNLRFMCIVAPDPILGNNLTIAGNTQFGSATSPTTLTCAGFSPGYLNGLVVPPVALISELNVDGWGIGVFQTSGSPLTISNVKFWAVTA